MLRVLGGSYGVGYLLMGEVPLYGGCFGVRWYLSSYVFAGSGVREGNVTYNLRGGGGQGWEFSAERRENSLKGFKDVCLKTKARIWLECLIYVPYSLDSGDGHVGFEQECFHFNKRPFFNRSPLTNKSPFTNKRPFTRKGSQREACSEGSLTGTWVRPARVQGFLGLRV